MNQLLLSPTDVLFFRDGRPMGGSLSGHGAAWPLPTVTNAALHAALHRAALQGVHGHDHHQKSGGKITDARKFGSLLTAGPFPVIKNKDAADSWLFPRPLDAGIPNATSPSFLPLKRNDGESSDIPWHHHSSLPEPLIYATANTELPSKKTPAPWWNQAAWDAYLTGQSNHTAGFHHDSDFSDTEHQIGIGIDPATGTQDGERFYSAHYLRLKPDHHLGLLAEAQDKINGDPSDKRDLIADLFPNSGTRSPVIVGGQQRLCNVRRESKEPIPLPRGKSSDFLHDNVDGSDVWLVKWILLSPAIFPAINNHLGGWLPSWIRQTDGQVMLKSGDTGRGDREGRASWRKRIAALPEIPATLVAALTGKPIPVTGYALPHEEGETRGGPKPTQLAVPAGSVYYFTCPTAAAAEKLAAALNWHGSEITSSKSQISNRRSTLFGEKGFGLGVCGTWKFHDGKLPR